MKIVVDADIPYVRGLFEPFAEVEYIKGGEIGRRDVMDADALIVRTRTKCDSALLGGSKIKIVATATIGLDHIDELWCATNGVEVVSAAGCNARAVAQWVFAGLNFLGINSGTIGIIGVGNVGSEVKDMAHWIGFDTILCDPPLAEIQKARCGSLPADPPLAAQGQSDFVSLDQVLKTADVITLHVPLLNTTTNMVDAHFLNKIKRGALLLNSSRGEVVNQDALLNSNINYGLDVWGDEPNINVELLKKALIATPHIAGYSARGKARGTQAVVRAVANFLGIEALKNTELDNDFELEMPQNFDISVPDAALRANPSAFEQLRTIRL